MKINIEEILEAQARRGEINSTDIKEIEWYLDGVKLSIPAETLEEWRFTGLSNTDFVNFCIPELNK